MPLTPEDVQAKRFHHHRLPRNGYDMTEVDLFLDEVEEELQRLLQENAELRRQLALATGEEVPEQIAVPASAASESTEGGDDSTGGTDSEASAPTADAGPAEAAPAPAPVTVTTAAEASTAATRLLELATRNADEVVAEARAEAQQIVSVAKEQADTLDREARTRAENLDQETAERRTQALSSIEAEKSRLDGEVGELATFEREYRSRLRSYFTQQLDALDGKGEGGELPAAHGHPQDVANDEPAADEPVDGHS